MVQSTEGECAAFSEGSPIQRAPEIFARQCARVQTPPRPSAWSFPTLQEPFAGQTPADIQLCEKSMHMDASFVLPSSRMAVQLGQVQGFELRVLGGCECLVAVKGCQRMVRGPSKSIPPDSKGVQSPLGGGGVYYHW